MDRQKKYRILSELFRGNKALLQRQKEQDQGNTTRDLSHLSDEDLRRLVYIDDNLSPEDWYRFLYVGMSDEAISQQLERSDKALILRGNVDLKTLSDQALYRLLYAGMNDEEISRQRELRERARLYMTDEELDAIISGKICGPDINALIGEASKRSGRT